MFDFVASPKIKMINVRLTPEVHDAFKIACNLRGASMSSFLHQTIVRTIREEREREPQAFTKPERQAPTGIRSVKTPAKAIEEDTAMRKAK